MVYTTLRADLGVSKLELSGRTVREVIQKLCELRGGTPGKRMLDKDGNVKQHFVLTLNSEIVDNKKTELAHVEAGDILHVFPPVSGG